MTQNPFIDELHLQGNNISSFGMQQICQSLTNTSTRVKVINMQWNNIGNGLEGIKALLQMVKTNSSVVQVDIRNNYIGNDMVDQIAMIIKDSRGLKSLLLGWNQINNDGVK